MKLQHLLHDGRTSNISSHVVHPRILCNSSLYRLDTTTSNSGGEYVYIHHPLADIGTDLPQSKYICSAFNLYVIIIDHN